MSILDDVSVFVSREIECIIAILDERQILDHVQLKEILEKRKNNVFQGFGTEFLQFQKFSELGTYIEPEKIIFGEKVELSGKKKDFSCYF